MVECQCYQEVWVLVSLPSTTLRATDIDIVVPKGRVVQSKVLELRTAWQHESHYGHTTPVSRRLQLSQLITGRLWLQVPSVGLPPGLFYGLSPLANVFPPPEGLACPRNPRSLQCLPQGRWSPQQPCRRCQPRTGPFGFPCPNNRTRPGT